MSKILVRTKGWIDTEEDDYEHGCLPGKFGVSWDFDCRGTYDNVGELKDAVRKATYWSLTDDMFFFYDGALRFSITVDVDNNEPSESQLERWRRGEERMWLADGCVSVWVVPDGMHEMTDEEAKAFGLEVY